MTAASKLATPLTVLGAVLVAAAFIYSYSGLNNLQADIEAKQAKRDDLDAAIRELEDERDFLKTGPLSELVRVDALAVKLDGRRDPQGRQLYDFSLWLDVPNNRKQDIREVRYRRLAGERLQDVLVGTEPSNGFRRSYLGWGCFDKVDVVIVKTTGEETPPIRVDQCRILRSGGMVWGD